MKGSPRKFFKKVKVIPQKNQKKKSPSISRSFPEKPHSASLLDFLRYRSLYSLVLSTAAICFFGAILVSLYNLKKVEEQKKIVDSRYNAKLEQINYWQGVVKQHPDYRDGYFELAVLEYEIGDREKSREYVGKALYLDPNYEQGRKLEQILSK